MLRSRILAGTAAAFAAALSASAAYADITILAWPGEPAESAFRKVLDLYNSTAGKENNSKASVIYFSQQGFKEKMLADVAAGSKEFDVMLTATYDVGLYAPFMTPIDDIVTPAVYDVISKNAIETQRYEGKVYGIPTDLSLHFLYYRKDLIEKLLTDDAWKAKYGEISEEILGTKMEPKKPDDWTWDDYIATALFFTKSLNSDSPTRYGTVLQMKNLLYNIMLWQGTAASYGGDWRDAAGNITIDSEAYRKGLAIYKTITDNEATPGDSNTYEYGEANSVFGAGQAAFMVQWNAAVPEFNDPKKYPEVVGKLGLTHEPAGTLGPKTHFHSLGLGINKNSEKQDEAKKFLAWLATAEPMKLYAKEGGSPPLAEKPMAEVAADRPEMLLMGEHAAKYGFVMNGGTSSKALAIYTNQAENFTGYWTGATELDPALKNVVDYMTKAFAK
ncbi:ABC transporter substrate-binding protein [Kaistia algarum]|uniref:extracellular solute-binding protein n=1 Tax=Kaistia algarum TaxID=2083279 RepID=UPI000CE8FF32|nr:extracellular solute-binding protein [Kaistia algarum]MCX5513323.1 extracellular solute-binding protein [Kaistia algarum]PPE81225.1 ABC transporter substrate-binding protein [Kaistia algarum]